jgi:hypothetical protein
MTTKRSKTPTTSLLLLLVACVAACGGLGVDDRYELRRGTIDPYFNIWKDTTLFVPQETSVFEPVTVRVITEGGGCVRKGPTEVGVDGLMATIEPYDSVCVGCVCTRELFSIEHVAVFQYAETGQGTVRIVARLAPGDTVATVQYSMMVRDP